MRICKIESDVSSIREGTPRGGQSSELKSIPGRIGYTTVWSLGI